MITKAARAFGANKLELKTLPKLAVPLLEYQNIESRVD